MRAPPFPACLAACAALAFPQAPARASGEPAAAPPQDQSACRQAPEVIALWPGAAPGRTEAAAGAERDEPGPAGHLLPRKASAVTRPTLTVFRPRGVPNAGTALLVCPGGGYREVEMGKEGEEVALWLNGLGITAAVLKYRVPAPAGLPKSGPALQDAQRALRIVRARAAGWGIRTDRIGMIGFSAGANLGVLAATGFSRNSYAQVDNLDTLSCRPDFAVLAYPGDLLAPGGGARLDPGIRIGPGTPPMFLVQTETDRVNADNSLVLYGALKRAGIPAELHLFARGAHGFAVRPSPYPVGNWTRLCADWMGGEGLLGR